MASKSPYLSESPLTSYIPPLILGLVVYALNDWLFKLLVDFVHPALQHFKPDWVISSACLSGFVIAIKFTIDKVYNNRKPTLLSLWYCLLIICLYIFVVRPNPYAYFFKCFGWNHIYISDLLLSSSLLFSISYIYIDEPPVVNSTLTLLEDLPHSISQNSDPLSRHSFAAYIADVIKATVPEKALAISVLSDWGYGKTSFLNSIKDRLTSKDNPDNLSNIVLEFNPWKFEKSGQLLNHFFDELETTFKPYDDRVAAGLRDYADKLTEAEDPSLIKLFTQSLAKLFGNSKSLTDRYDSLNKAITRSGKRLIIILDDLDRLMPDELVTMMRLIRNTADFPNTFFIAAFDQYYVMNALASSGSIAKHENYLRKIFQLEIPLPPIDNKVISSSLREYLYKGMSEEAKDLFEEVLLSVVEPEPDLASFFKQNGGNELQTAKVRVVDFLDNIRDVKRFVNSFRITYSIIGNEVDLYDLLILELIKYRIPALYNKVATQSLISSSYGHRSIWSLDDKAFESFFESPEMKSINGLYKEKEFFKKTFETLLSTNRTRTSRSVLFKDTFHLYFHYQLFDSISIHEFEQARTNGQQELENYFRTIANNKRLDQLIIYIERISAFRSKEDFEAIVSCIAMIVSDYDANSGTLENLLTSIEVNVVTYYEKTVEQYEDFIRGLIKNEKLKVTVRSKIASLFLERYAMKAPVTLFQETELKDMLLSILEFTIITQPENDNTIYEIYKQNWESTNRSNNSVKISEKANEFLKDYLNKYPLKLTKQLYWYSDRFSHEWIEINPYMIQVFGSYEAFEMHVVSLPKTKCSKFLLATFKKIKKNNFKSVSIPDFDESNPCLAV